MDALPGLDSAVIPEAVADTRILRPRLKPAIPDLSLRDINSSIDAGCLAAMFTQRYRDLVLTPQELETDPGRQKLDQLRKDTIFLIKTMDEDGFSLDELIERKKIDPDIPDWVNEKLIKSEEFLVNQDSSGALLSFARLFMHDLRIPLTSISGYEELLKTKRSEEDVNKYLGIIIKKIKNLDAIKKSLGLVFHDGQIETIVLSSEPASALYDDFDKQVSIMRENLLDKGINIRVIEDPSQQVELRDSVIQIDQDKIAHALINCIVNVLDEKVKKGVNVQTIAYTVKASPDGKFVDAFVMDDGNGFPEGPDFVDPQTNSGVPKPGVTTKADQEGTGTGLGESAQLLKKFGCEVTIHNGSKIPLPEGLTLEEGLKGGIVRIRIPKIWT